MRRRDFIGLTATTVVWPFATYAQQLDRMRRIGFLGLIPPSAPTVKRFWDGFHKGLAERGWVEGQNLLIEARWLAGKREKLPEMVEDLVASRPEVIVVVGSETTQAVKKATSTIPIVFAGAGNPVASGFVASLAKPGGNVTGVSNQLDDLVEKKLQLLLEIVPEIKSIGLIWEPANSSSVREFEDLQAVCSRLGITLMSFPLKSEQDLELTYKKLAEGPPQALVTGATTIAGQYHKQIADFAMAHRLPTVTDLTSYVHGGMLVGYSPDVAAIWRRAGHYVDQLLRGAKAAEMPVEQPTKFELVLNGRTAKTLGLTFPITLHARADEVIE
jgi:putative tryptophan/tyrosine transport system substrate-binding protein